jgi:hypothetical protein
LVGLWPEYIIIGPSLAKFDPPGKIMGLAQV